MSDAGEHPKSFEKRFGTARGGTACGSRYQSSKRSDTCLAQRAHGCHACLGVHALRKCTEAIKAPPSRTSSQARKQAMVLRTAAHPEGFWNDPDLAEASDLAKITFAIAERAAFSGCFSVENPLASLAGRLPAAVRAARIRGVRLLERERSTYGGQHQKATGMLTIADWLPGPP